jgi:hypothetical protein
MKHDLEFTAYVPLVIEGVTLAEDLECEVTGTYDDDTGDAEITDIVFEEGKRRLRLGRSRYEVGDDSGRGALWKLLAPRIEASVWFKTALEDLISDEGLADDPVAEHRLGAFEYGVGGYA